MRPDATIALAQRLQIVAQHLTAFGPHVMCQTAAVADAAGWPGGGATTGERVKGGSPGSSTETAALAGDDRLITEHRRLVDAIGASNKVLDEIEAILNAWQPARALMDNAPCPQMVVDDGGQVLACSGVLTQTEMSCRTCGMSRSTRTCRSCAKIMNPGHARRQGMCLKCYRKST